jgi:hypothetical protein
MLGEMVETLAGIREQLVRLEATTGAGTSGTSRGWEHSSRTSPARLKH